MIKKVLENTIFLKIHNSLFLMCGYGKEKICKKFIDIYFFRLVRYYIFSPKFLILKFYIYIFFKNSKIIKKLVILKIFKLALKYTEYKFIYLNRIRRLLKKKTSVEKLVLK